MLPEFTFIESLKNAVTSGERVISVSGLTSVSSKAYVLSALAAATGNCFTIIAGTNLEIDSWQFDLEFWLGQLRSGDEPKNPEVVSIPAFETDPYAGISPHAETQERRALALWQLSRDAPLFSVTSLRALMAQTPSPTSIANLGIDLSLDDELPLSDLLHHIEAVGYVREDPIYNFGQYSIRGGILDIWPPDSETPFRIEFFGDTVDSIRTFDAETQLSTGQVKSAAVSPMREVLVSANDFVEWTRLARERFGDTSFARALEDRTDLAENGESFPGWEFLLPLAKPHQSSLFELLGERIFVIDEPVVVEDAAAKLYDDLNRRSRHLLDHGELCLAPDELFLDPTELRENLSERRLIELRTLGRTASSTDEEFTLALDESTSAANSPPPLFLFPAAERAIEIEITSRPPQRFHGDLARFAHEFRSKDAARALFVMGSSGMAERLAEILRDYEISVAASSILVGSIDSGFELPSTNLTVWAETDIFGERDLPDTAPPARQTRGHTARLGAFISDFRDLKPGDFVVHVDHGIGRFEGLQTISAQGIEREFMLLVYADNTKLFVPVERLDLVSRYSSGEAAAPSLDRLGGVGWQKTKARAKRAMRDMADELLRLYAERKLVKGFAFSPDAPWQHEFEDAFPYDLTIDQAKAIDDVKEDMETARPMDRLIIGDVGYGKTEVAMRAAFKAVMDSKQVAILAPTTVLAYQHYETFKKRFSAFPARIDLLSRFRSSKEQKSVAEAAQKGEVDVLIGTHRILSNDVSLPKLGLVVVDEEQRFGVAHKEKLKHLKKKVDVLTLSATPIPRTLNMSMLGMRDMSVIETPPRDRLAINTQVVQFSESVIRSAIDLELARNGQVFFIHNRVETIEAIAALVQKIVPDARIAVGHGQMNEKEMEQIMLDFIDYKYDVLVATTIIENGIDIPRANTIIINRADNYGLSQLYQLRGRVGRSNRRAYAYLLIPSELELTPIARRRLSAIREFSDLGAGFRIAALDLELRGAGNILGGQQSGHLEALGFDLYTKMLERTIAELRGDEIADESSVSINLGVDVSIPKDYISDTSQRLRTYKRIASAVDEATLFKIRSEIEDRYGRLPSSVEDLFEYGRLRKLAEGLNIVSIDKTADGLAVKLNENSRISPDKLMEIVSSDNGASFSPSGILRVPVTGGSPLQTAQRTLREIAA